MHLLSRKNNEASGILFRGFIIFDTLIILST